MSTADAVLRLVSVGVVWMAVHCAGMCGPLLVGLDVSGAARGTSPLRGALRMLQYQGGRAVTYAALGGLAGLLGGGLAQVSALLGAVLAVALGLVALVRALTLVWPRRELVRIGRRDTSPPSPMTKRLAALARPVVASTSPLRPALLGVVLGFLPCMIALWALGLAALTGSALGGAAVMLSLVVMTTPVIVAIGAATRLVGEVPSWLRARLPPALLAVSGAWLVLVGAAGAGVIGHAHVALGSGYVVMLW